MRRISIVCAALLLAVSVLGATTALATPNPNSAVFHLRVFNDCPTSILDSGSTYPANVFIHDMPDCATGFANLHVWRLSEDGTTPAVFNNGDSFSLTATLTLTGTSNEEAGLQIAPWWSQDVDGRFNVRVPDGEIACFGGRLPFYSFTANFGLHYALGEPIQLGMIYLPHDLTAENPATIEYQLTYLGQSFTSGPLAFDEGNPAEEHGTWGMLNDARVGGHFQPLVAPAADLRADWNNITYEILTPPVPVETTTWGAIKHLYR